MENLNNVLCFVYCLLSIIISLCIASFFMRLNIPNRRKLVIGILFLDFIFNLLIVSNVSNVSNRLKLSILYLFVFISFILAIIISLYYNRQIDYTRILRNVRPFSVFLLTISVGYIIVRLMVHKFNDDSWWINENNISNSIDKWGDFATFFGGIFALISIYLAYRAFISQVNAARRASFDATFTQIFAQHKALHDKAVRHSVIRKISIGSTDIFTICRMVFERVYADSNNGCIMIEEFYQRFNSRINPYIGLYSSIEARDMVSCVSVDLKNYFKYIYHEINIVVSQPDDVLDRDAKRDYIQLIQAQMNYDELICYFINQVEYLTYWRRIRFGNIPNNSQTHAENLRYYRFFHELCRSRSVHVSLVRNVMRNHRFEVLMLIDEDWLS